MITTDKNTLPRDKAKELTRKFYEAMQGNSYKEFLQAQACVFVFLHEVFPVNADYYLEVSKAVDTISYDEFKTLEPCK